MSRHLVGLTAAIAFTLPPGLAQAQARRAAAKLEALSQRVDDLEAENALKQQGRQSLLDLSNAAISRMADVDQSLALGQGDVDGALADIQALLAGAADSALQLEGDAEYRQLRLASLTITTAREALHRSDLWETRQALAAAASIALGAYSLASSH